MPKFEHMMCNIYTTLMQDVREILNQISCSSKSLAQLPNLIFCTCH